MERFSALSLSLQLLLAVQAYSELHPLSVTPPHQNYMCPEGANVTLSCARSGSRLHPTDQLHHTWLFTPNTHDHCHRGLHPRGTTSTNHSMGVAYGTTDQLLTITLHHLKHSDQGRYCCLLRDIHQHRVEKESHSYILLTVTTQTHNSSRACVKWSQNPPADSLAEGFAIAASVAFILCLPLILMMVYRQRRTVETSRRAHELVRMDSESHGHENPVFTCESPKPRALSLLTRQPSESGRHLLSDPESPFSPNIQGELFFSMPDPISESARE